MNLSGEKSRYVTHIERLRAVFPGILRLVPVEGEDNILLFGFSRRELADLPDFLQDRATRLERGFGLQFSRYLERLRAGPVLTGPMPRVRA
jgi:hypothetical protein